MKKMYCLMIGLLLLPFMAFAASQDSATALVNKVTQGKATVVKEFNSIDNLKGFVLKPNQQGAPEVVMYADKDGQYAVIGTLINSNLQNVSQQDFMTYIQPQQAQGALKAIDKTTWFSQGSKTAKHVAYVIAEPNCSICHMLYTQFAPFVKSGDLQVRWILVHFIRPNSEGKAAAILSAKDPVAAMIKNEDNFDVASEEGGIKPLKTIPKDISSKLAQNNQFMQKFGFNGTPVVLFTDNQGKSRVIEGLPPKGKLQAVIDSMSAAS